MSSKKKTPRLAERYIYSVAEGSPFTEEDAKIIGPGLLKIAEDNRTDVRSLDGKLIFETVENDPDSFFWKVSCVERDTKQAARKHWIEFASLMRRSIRFVTIDMPASAKPMPLTIYAPDHAGRVDADGKTRRGHVLTEDVLANDPAFASACGHQIRLISLAVGKLDHITSMRPSPREVIRLRDELKEVLNRYFSAIADAAE